MDQPVVVVEIIHVVAPVAPHDHAQDSHAAGTQDSGLGRTNATCDVPPLHACRPWTCKLEILTFQSPLSHGSLQIAR